MKKTELNQEITRIKREYSRRGKEIPIDFYSLEHPSNLYAYIHRLRAVVGSLSNEGLFPLSNKIILEVGCGNGSWLVDFQRWGAEQKNLYGIDLVEEKIATAKEFLPCADLRAADASSLPWPGEKFDIVLQSTVFTSILDDSLKMAIAKEMLRVLKPQGIILWYDFLFNNPNNPNVRGIRAKEIQRIFPRCKIKLKRITLAPPIARVIARYSYFACYVLERIRLLNTHYLGVIKSAEIS